MIDHVIDNVTNHDEPSRRDCFAQRSYPDDIVRAGSAGTDSPMVLCTPSIHPTLSEGQTADLLFRFATTESIRLMP